MGVEEEERGQCADHRGGDKRRGRGSDGGS